MLRSAIARSGPFAFATALGITTGLMAWGIAAAVGVSALLAASELAYRILTMAGAAYMVWLGASLLWKSRSRGPGSAEGPAAVGLPPPSGHQFLRGWLTGTGTNLLNPRWAFSTSPPSPSSARPGRPRC
ncbi:hypothetical protein GCM10009712_25560 [Pseudarthrobacter sulfonivorans]